jgi:hypothetical protein
MSADSLQLFMAAAIQRPKSLVGDADMARACASHIRAGARLSPVEQLEIYREQFFFRHIDALAEDFPGARYLLGADRFNEVAVAYLGAHPPESFTLRDLGNRFSDFLRRTGALSIACDMAELEWAFVEVFDAKGAPRMDPARLAEVPADRWSDAILRLHPTLRRVSLLTPVHRIREAIVDGEAPEVPAPERSFVVLFRDELQLRYDEIEEAAFTLLSLLAEGVPLGAACDRTVSAHPGDEDALSQKLQGWFQRWMSLGWIADVVVSP